MSAPPDLRAALHVMALEATPLDSAAAEEMIARGRGRRRRQVMGGLAVAACAAVVLPIVVSTVFDRVDRMVDPSGTPASGVRYDPTVDAPLPFLRDLPTQLNEPLALTYVMNVEGDRGWRAVSASGRQWLLPGSDRGPEPTLSPDGWKVAWSDSDQVIVRDLRHGSDLSVDIVPWSGQGRVLGGVMQAPWSADARYLGLNLHTLPSGDGLLVVIDTETGDEIELPEMAVMGWLDTDTMLGYSYAASAESTEAEPLVELLAIELDGIHHARRRLDGGHPAVDRDQRGHRAGTRRHHILPAPARGVGSHRG